MHKRREGREAATLKGSAKFTVRYVFLAVISLGCDKLESRLKERERRVVPRERDERVSAVLWPGE